MPRDLSLSSIFLHLIKNIYCLCKMVLKISKLQDVEKAPLWPAKYFEKQNKIEVETTGPWKQSKNYKMPWWTEKIHLGSKILTRSNQRHFVRLSNHWTSFSIQLTRKKCLRDSILSVRNMRIKHCKILYCVFIQCCHLNESRLFRFSAFCVEPQPEK